MIEEILREKKALTEARLGELLKTDMPAHETLFASMNYSLLAGGKRIRPALFLMTLDLLGEDSAKYIDAACALECVHTYSLIHDDLPQMDNDDYRRGRLTNHKVFGAGMATMAGDGLLTAAFSILAQMDLSAEIRCRLIEILADAAGPSGMVGGQAQDIEAEGKTLTEGELRTLDACKTGCLLAAPVEMASVIAEIENDKAAALYSYALHLGLLFQIVDDILDVTGDLQEMGKKPGQDAADHKSTWATLLGLTEARRAAADEAAGAKEALSSFGEEAAPLRELADYLLSRTK